MGTRQESLDRVCKHRNLPSLEIGAECEADGRKGVIVGGNFSSNLSVLFDGDNHIRNCHPDYRMRIFNKNGGLVRESDDLYVDPCEHCGAVQPIDCQDEHICQD